MSDIVLRFVGGPVYEGRPGWPAKDLTQEELDARGLDKKELLAYRPKLYEEVKSDKPRLYEAIEQADAQQRSIEALDVTEAAWLLAWEHDLDLTEVEGSGVGGRILLSDVEGLLE